jgi:hypothetical protein
VLTVLLDRVQMQRDYQSSIQVKIEEKKAVRDHAQSPALQGLIAEHYEELGVNLSELGQIERGLPILAYHGLSCEANGSPCPRWLDKRRSLTH